MQIIKFFSVFKNKPNENPKLPTHRMSAKIGESYLDIGACWTKESKNGDKFLSAKLADVFVDHTDNSKSRKSIVLVFEEDLVALHKKAGEDYVNESEVPAKKPTEAPKTSQEAF